MVIAMDMGSSDAKGSIQIAYLGDEYDIWLNVSNTQCKLRSSTSGSDTFMALIIGY